MPDTYQPSDEQIEALCAADFAADSDNVQWDECVIKDAWRDDMRALTRSPAFQAIIRAAQAEAYDEGWDDAIDKDGECPVAGPDMTCGQCAKCTPPNPYRESADV